jgi:hypothetical protein
MQPEILEDGGNGPLVVKETNAQETGDLVFYDDVVRTSRVAAFDPWERKWSLAPQPNRLASLIDPLTN